MNLKQGYLIPLFILGFLLVFLPVSSWAMIKNNAAKQPTPTDSPIPTIPTALPVSAELDGTCVRQKPTLSITPITQTGTIGQMLTYNVFFQNMDADCPPTTFTFTPQVDTGWSVQITPTNVQFANGGSMNTTMTVTSSKTAVNNDYEIGLGVSSDYPIHEQTVTVTYKLLFASPL